MNKLLEFFAAEELQKQNCNASIPEKVCIHETGHLLNYIRDESMLK